MVDKMKIFIIEPREIVADYIKKILIVGSHAFYTDGSEQCSKIPAVNSSYNWVLLDLDAAQSAVKLLNETNCQVPVICLTNRYSAGNSSQGPAICQGRYLGVPFTKSELLNKLQAHRYAGESSQ